MKIRPASSGRTIDEAMACVQEIYSWSELLEFVDEKFDFWSPTRER